MSDGMYEAYADLAAHSGSVPCAGCGMWKHTTEMVEVDGYWYCPGECAKDAQRQAASDEQERPTDDTPSQATLRELYAHPNDCTCPRCEGEA